MVMVPNHWDSTEGISVSGMDSDSTSKASSGRTTMLIAPDVQTQLDAAAGALALGNWREAHEKLEGLPADRLATPEVLVLRCRAYTKAGRWAEAEMVASGAAATYPNEHSFPAQW